MACNEANASFTHIRGGGEEEGTRTPEPQREPGVGIWSAGTVYPPFAFERFVQRLAYVLRIRDVSRRYACLSWLVLDRMSMCSRRSAPSCGSVLCRSVTVTAEVRIRRRVEVRVLSSETGPGGGAGSAGRRRHPPRPCPRRAAPAARAGRRVTERGCWRYAVSNTPVGYC